MQTRHPVIALAGNPNAGKTTFFNAATGAHQHVGNYPGITVEKKEGHVVVEGQTYNVVDLPGTYSLTAYSTEELVARDFLARQRPDVVLDVINAGALERNLYLAVQLFELGAPVVLVLNMMDEAEKRGLRIDTRRLSALIGAPVVAVVARAGLGVPEALRAAVRLAREREGAGWTPLRISYGPDLDHALEAMSASIEGAGFLTDQYPARWTALKYLEGDEDVLARGRAAGPLSQELEARSARVAEHCRATLDTYPEAIIADYRYGFIASLLRQGVLVRDNLRRRIDLTDRLDRVLTHRFLGPVLMLAILYLVYQITFVLGDAPRRGMDALFAWMGATAEAVLPPGLLRSLVVSGVINGIGGVLGFVPLIMLIFLQIAFLEDSGYMARVAYMLDRVFRIFGLHGCSVMPFVISGGIGGGCAVPGVMAARTLRSPREKLATMLTAPFMTCGAKLPVFLLLVGVFFPNREAVVLFGITLAGWAAALLAARLLRSTIIAGPPTPFVMELPPYRLPTVRGMLIHTWERTWQYIKKAGTVILAISILLWAAMTFPRLDAETLARFDAQRERAVAELTAAGKDDQAVTAAVAAIEAAQATQALRQSLAGRLGVALEPVTRLAGLEWRLNIALLGGVAAKEVIVSTLGTAYSLGGESEDSFSLGRALAEDPSWTLARGLSVMVFVLLYSPCFATVAAIRQESGTWRWAAFSVFFDTIVAFFLAVLVFQIGSRI
jgi:ferrous iron transport protein B